MLFVLRLLLLCLLLLLLLLILLLPLLLIVLVPVLLLVLALVLLRVPVCVPVLVLLPLLLLLRFCVCFISVLVLVHSLLLSGVRPTGNACGRCVRIRLCLAPRSAQALHPGQQCHSDGRPRRAGSSPPSGPPGRGARRPPGAALRARAPRARRRQAVLRVLSDRASRHGDARDAPPARAPVGVASWSSKTRHRCGAARGAPVSLHRRPSGIARATRGRQERAERGRERRPSGITRAARGVGLENSLRPTARQHESP